MTIIFDNKDLDDPLLKSWINLFKVSPTFDVEIVEDKDEDNDQG